MLLNQSFKPVIELVLEIILTNLQVQTTKFVTFTTQKPSDIQVMMFAVLSHANANLFNWQEANLKYFGWNLLAFIRHEFIVKDLFYGSPSWNFLAPAVNSVIFIAQRPSVNIALLGEWSLR